jgi:hypothetical protein
LIAVAGQARARREDLPSPKDDATIGLLAGGEGRTRRRHPGHRGVAWGRM